MPALTSGTMTLSFPGLSFVVVDPTLCIFPSERWGFMIPFGCLFFVWGHSPYSPFYLFESLPPYLWVSFSDPLSDQ